MYCKRLFLFCAPLTLAACQAGQQPNGGHETAETSQAADSRAIESFRQAVEADDDRTVGEQASDAAEAGGEHVASAFGSAKDSVKGAWDKSVDTAGDAVDGAKDKLGYGKDQTQEKSEQAADKVKDVAEDAADATRDGAEDAKDGAKDIKDSAADKAGDAKDATADKAGELHSRGADKANTAVEQAKFAYDGSRRQAERLGRDVEHATLDLRDFATETLQQAAQDVIDAEENLQAREEDRANQILKEANAAYGNAHQDGETALERGADKAEDAAEDVQKAASSMVDRVRQNAHDAKKNVERAAHDSSEYVKHKAARARDNVWNHQEEFRKKNIETYERGTDAAASGWETFKHGTKVLTTPVVATANYTADRFHKSAAWANQVRKDAVAWERSRRTRLEKNVVSGSASVSGYLAGIFSGTVRGAKEKGQEAVDATSEAAAEAKLRSQQAAADALRSASDKLDDAADHTEPTSDYASVGLGEMADAHMGYALGVELFANRICEHLRDVRQLNADEMASCLNHQRELYKWFYNNENCVVHGFAAERLDECLNLAPQTAGGNKGEAHGFTAPFNSASRKFFWNCSASKICLP